jgi:hypothetical protein
MAAINVITAENALTSIINYHLFSGGSLHEVPVS